MTTTDITTAAASRLAVGTRIRDRRVALAATMPEFAAVKFARRLHITVGHLYQIETGRVRASAGLLARIGSLLAMDVNRLLAANGQIAPALEEALLRCPAAWGKIAKELE
jgi:transcriptional regulator with XRE-family HTH domain